MLENPVVALSVLSEFQRSSHPQDVIREVHTPTCQAYNAFELAADVLQRSVNLSTAALKPLISLDS